MTPGQISEVVDLFCSKLSIGQDENRRAVASAVIIASALFAVASSLDSIGDSVEKLNR